MTTYLTAKDLQDLIRVDKSTIYRMAEDGRLPAVKVGRQWRFPEREVPDPYYGGPAGFERVIDMLEDASQGLLDALVLARRK